MSTAATTTIRERFSSEAANWDRLYSPEGPASIYEHNLIERRETALRFIGTPANRVLDVGCGAGNVILRVPGTDQIIGMDFSIPMLHQARASAHQANRKLGLMASNATSLPFSDASTGAVIALGVLEYVPNPSAALSEIHRVLEPGGTLVLSSPNARSPFVTIDDTLKALKNTITQELLPTGIRRSLKRLMGKADQSYFTHKRHRFAPDQIRESLETLGFEITEEKFHTFGFGVLGRSSLNLALCRKLESWATTHPKLEKLGWTIVLKAKKLY